MALSAEDRLDILDLAARYNHALDGGDPDGWAATFTEDGVFEGGREPVTGTDALKTFAMNFSKNMPGGRHWTTNHVIDGDGQSATHSCYLQLLSVDEEGVRTVTTGIYRDTLVRGDGGWRFASRKVTPDRRPS